MDYYYTDRSNEPRGPISLEELHSLADAGVVNSYTMVAPVGSQNWSPIGTLIPTLAMPGQGIYAPTTTDPLAICSLVFSLVALLPICLCGVFSAIFAIPGIVCGHISLAKISRQPEIQGKGLAIAGLAIGYSTLLICAVLLAIVIIGMVAGAASP